MNVQQRMSPFTAFFMAVFGIVAVGVGAGTTLALFGLYMIDNKAEMLIGFAEGTIDGLPELIANLPPAIGDVLDDRRVPEYASNVDIDITFLADEKTGLLQPALTIVNEGDEVLVKVLDVDKKTGKIRLSRKAALDYKGEVEDVFFF